MPASCGPADQQSPLDEGLPAAQRDKRDRSPQWRRFVPVAPAVLMRSELALPSPVLRGLPGREDKYPAWTVPVPPSPRLLRRELPSTSDGSAWACSSPGGLLSYRNPSCPPGRHRGADLSSAVFSSQCQCWCQLARVVRPGRFLIFFDLVLVYTAPGHTRSYRNPKSHLVPTHRLHSNSCSASSGAPNDLRNASEAHPAMNGAKRHQLLHKKAKSSAQHEDTAQEDIGEVTHRSVINSTFLSFSTD